MPILLPILLFAAATAPYDLVIRNGHVIDGTGSPWYAADIGIRAGKIAAIGRLTDAPAERTIDARGMVVAPGFIDMLGQSEMTILVNPHLPSKIFQGITTEVTGEGSSIAPLNDAIFKADRVTWEHYGMQPTWRTFRDYFARLRKQGMGINLASYVGATQVRRMVFGDDDRAPNAGGTGTDEGAGARCHAGRRGGASPHRCSTRRRLTRRPEELIALAAEAAKFGGIYASHIRDEGDSHHAGAGRSFPHRARGEHPGGDLASEGGGQVQLGADAGDRGAYRGGAQIRAWTWRRTRTRIRRRSTPSRR